MGDVAYCMYYCSLFALLKCSGRVCWSSRKMMVGSLDSLPWTWLVVPSYSQHTYLMLCHDSTIYLALAQHIISLSISVFGESLCKCDSFQDRNPPAINRKVGMRRMNWEKGYIYIYIFRHSRVDRHVFCVAGFEWMPVIGVRVCRYKPHWPLIVVMSEPSLEYEGLICTALVSSGKRGTTYG